jgi:hypothetical protein
VAEVWFTPVHKLEVAKRATGSVGVVHKLTSIQRLAIIAIMVVIKTTAMDTLEAHMNILPIELFMHEVCHCGAIRLETLPKAHPLHQPVCSHARCMVK